MAAAVLVSINVAVALTSPTVILIFRIVFPPMLAHSTTRLPGRAGFPSHLWHTFHVERQTAPCGGGRAPLDTNPMQAGSSPTWRFDAELAWLGFWRRPARTLVGTWAVIVAVAAVTFVLSLGDGLHEYLSRRLQAFTPALWVQATGPVREAPAHPPAGAPAEDPTAGTVKADEFAGRLGELPGVTAVSKHVLIPVLASSERRSSPARLEGYEPEAILEILPAARSALEGRLPTAEGEIVLGAEARSRSRRPDWR